MRRAREGARSSFDRADQGSGGIAGSLQTGLNLEPVHSSSLGGALIFARTARKDDESAINPEGKCAISFLFIDEVNIRGIEDAWKW